MLFPECIALELHILLIIADPENHQITNQLIYHISSFLRRNIDLWCLRDQTCKLILNQVIPIENYFFFMIVLKNKKRQPLCYTY